MKKFLAFILLLIIAFCGGLYVGAAGLISFGGDKDDISVDVLSEEVKEISEYSVHEVVSTEQGTIQNSKKFMQKYSIPFTEKTLTAQCKVVTKMGVCLDEADISLDKEAKVISVVIPHSQIMSQELDEDSWEIVTNQNGLFNGVKIEDDDKIRKSIKKVAKQRMKEEDQYAKADERAVETIKELFGMIHPKYTVEVTFKK
ncbi:MAG: DUF4230 domain-containing protein [Clostridiales bacterium]|nr:DUF4230 domain-containing protein [Candidatus Crickella merdequi]